MVFFQINTFMTIPAAVDRLDVMSSNYAFYSPKSSGGSYSKFYINVVAATADLSGLTMNGAFLQAASFTAVGTSSFSAARFSVSQGGGQMNHTNGRPFTAFMYGYFSAPFVGTVEGGGTILPSWNTSQRPSSFYLPSFCALTTVEPTVKTTTATTTIGEQTTSDVIANAYVTSSAVEQPVSAKAAVSSGSLLSHRMGDTNLTSEAWQGYMLSRAFRQHYFVKLGLELARLLFVTGELMTVPHQCMHEDPVQSNTNRILCGLLSRLSIFSM
jgi:hypothetical protein